MPVPIDLATWTALVIAATSGVTAVVAAIGAVWVNVIKAKNDERVANLEDTVADLKESDTAKDELITELKEELKTTATTCEAKIDNLVAELREVKDELKETRKAKDRAEERAALPAPAATTPTGQVAEGTISLEVVNKKGK